MCQVLKQMLQFKTKGVTSGSFKEGTNNYNFGAGQLGLKHRSFAG